MKVDLAAFDPQYRKRGYARRDAFSFALASYLAYTAEDVAARAKAWGFDEVKTFDARRGRDIDTQGFIAANDRRVLVAFRGTDSKADWLTNFQASRDPGPFARSKVHEGFQDAFFPAVLDIGRTLERFRTNRQDIWVTGHSLGGALAVELVAVLLRDRIDVSGLYTFGAPRLGNPRFADAFDERMKGRPSFRVANAGDLVPHVPMEPLFSHAGNRVLFDTDGSRKTSKGAWKGFKNLIWGWLGERLGDGEIVIKDAHVLDSNIGYLRRLRDDLG